MGRARLPPRGHQPDRQRRTARRPHRASTTAPGRHPPLHLRIVPVRRGADARLPDRGPCGAGPGCGHHDGPDDRLRRRDLPEGADRWRDGAPRRDVGNRYRSRPAARRSPDRRSQLASDLPRQRPARNRGLRPRPPLPARRSPSGRCRAGGLRSRRHGAAGRDARGLRARDDDRARQVRSPQHRPARRCPRRRRAVRVGRGACAITVDPPRRLPRSGAEREPRHERAGLDGDDGDARRRALLPLSRTRTRHRSRRTRARGRSDRRGADRRAVRPHRRPVRSAARHSRWADRDRGRLSAFHGDVDDARRARLRRHDPGHHRRLRALPDGQQHRGHA